MNLSLELSQNEHERLEKAAAQLGLKPEELARAAVNDLCSQSQEDFQQIATRVLEKNKSLYERLS
jgi:hypothetical protein